MRTSLFRTDAQQTILALLHLEADPERPLTVGGVSELTGIPMTTVSRELTRLRDAGLITERREGNQRRVTAVTSGPVAHHVRGLLLATSGAHLVLRRMLQERRAAGRDDLLEAVIFGSFAEFVRGELKRPPNDIDVLLVGDIDPQEAYDIAYRASLELSYEVNPVVRTAGEWETDHSGFAESVRRGRTIRLLDDVDQGLL
jgi:DNA-binding transcriptional ArsR family regulator